MSQFDHQHHKPIIIRASTVPLSLHIFCNGVLKELSERYEVIGLSSPGELLDEVAKHEGVKTIALPMARHISPWHDIVSLWNLVKVFRKEQPQMVHSMTPKAGLLCMVAGWLARVPVRVHTFTGLVFPSAIGLKRKILMLTDSLTCRCATHVLSEGEGVKADLMRHNISNKPIRVLGNGNVRGVDMAHYSRRPEVMKLANGLRDDNRFTFVFVGRVVRDKGINELCEAFVRLHEEHPQTRLWMVGPWEDDVDPISETARRTIEACNDIQTVGFIEGDELLAYYASADCYVFPSYREGFPNTVLEAGAMGLTCIVTDINGSREIIEEGKNGTIIPTKDVDALYESMKRMVEDTDWRTKLSGNARQMVESRYEQGYVRQCLYEFYQEILGS